MLLEVDPAVAAAVVADPEIGTDVAVAEEAVLGDVEVVEIHPDPCQVAVDVHGDTQDGVDPSWNDPWDPQGQDRDEASVA